MTSSDSDSDFQLHRCSPRKVILVSSSSESDIPGAGKGWRATKRVCSSSEEDHQPTRKLKKVKDRHLKKWCPVSGCRAGPQGRLSWHIKVYHQQISTKLRRHLTRTAEAVKRPKPVPIPRPEMTPTLPALLARMNAKAPRAAQSELNIQPVSGTRSFPRFAMSHPEIQKFLHFLRGLDGRRKSKTESLQVATDVSKYLKYARPSSDHPNWFDLLDDRKARAYLDMLNNTGACGASGQLTKIDRLLHALRYLRLEVAVDNAGVKYRSDIMEERLGQWKAAIRPEKKLQEEKGRAAAESDMITLTEATAVIKDKQIRLDVVAAISNVAGAGEGADMKDDIKLILAFLLTLLAYRSWQRPGAVTNATLEEFGATTKVVSGGDAVHVMKVGRHKTAREGPALITMSQSDKKMVLRYLKHVRPKCDVYGEAKVLFVSESGEPITHLNQRLQWLAVKYGIRVPSCTTLRTVAATASATELDPQDRLLISSHMSHSEKVHKKYYERLQTSQQAAVAFKIREKLIKGNETDSDESEVEQEPKKPAKKAATKPARKQHTFKVQYTDDELARIRRWIRTDLVGRSSVSLKESRQFLKSNPMARTPKNIQDKVKQLIEKDNESKKLKDKSK